MDPARKNPLIWPRLVQALVQSACMGLFILLAFFVYYGTRAELAVASLGASAFIAFSFPNAASSRPRFLIGGYFCGITMGMFCSLLLHHVLPPGSHNDLRVCILFCALAVALTGFFMIALRFQHPPSAALAIAMVMEPEPLLNGLTVMGLMLLLVGFRFLLYRAIGRHFGTPEAEAK